MTAAEALASRRGCGSTTARIHGSIALKGGRIDDVTLADYHETVDPASPEIVLLSPPGSPNPYFAEYGWVAGDAGVPVPGRRDGVAAEGGG